MIVKTRGCCKTCLQHPLLVLCNILCELFLPSYCTASCTTVFTIIFCKTTIAFTIYGGSTVFTGKYIFDGHGTFSLIIFNTFFSTCSDAFDVIAVHLIHNFRVVLPFTCMLHAAFAGVKYFVNYGFLAGFLRDSIISE